jgi:hypothetical protein
MKRNMTVLTVCALAVVALAAGLYTFAGATRKPAQSQQKNAPAPKGMRVSSEVPGVELISYSQVKNNLVAVFKNTTEKEVVGYQAQSGDNISGMTAETSEPPYRSNTAKQGETFEVVLPLRDVRRSELKLIAVTFADVTYAGTEEGVDAARNISGANRKMNENIKRRTGPDGSLKLSESEAHSGAPIVLEDELPQKGVNKNQ